MAEVKIKDAVVTRIIPNYGFKAQSTITLKSGEQKKETYTVWTDARANEGDVVNISGLLSVKIEEFKGREGNQVQYAAIHINNAKVEANAPF